MSKSVVLILFKDSFPEGMASTSRVHNYCKILKELGCQVIVASLNVNGSGEEIDHVDEVVQISKSEQKLFKQKRLFQSIVEILQQGKDKINTVIVYGFTAYVQRKLIIHFQKDINFYYELNEFPFSFKASRRDYIPCVNRIKRWWLIKRAFPLYDGMICISDSLKRFAEEHTNEKCINIKVPVLADVDSKFYLINDCEDRPPYLFHAGFLNEQKDGIINVFNAFAIAAKENLKLEFWLTVRKAEIKTLKKIDRIIEQNNLQDRVKFLGFLSKNEIWEKLFCATAVIICKPDNLQNRHNFPTKLSEYATIGVPVIYAGIGEAKNYINEKSALFVSMQPEEMASSIAKLLNDNDLQDKLSLEIQKVADNHFHYKRHLDKFKRLID